MHPLNFPSILAVHCTKLSLSHSMIIVHLQILDVIHPQPPTSLRRVPVWTIHYMIIVFIMCESPANLQICLHCLRNESTAFPKLKIPNSPLPLTCFPSPPIQPPLKYHHSNNLLVSPPENLRLLTMSSFIFSPLLLRRFLYHHLYFMALEAAKPGFKYLIRPPCSGYVSLGKFPCLQIKDHHFYATEQLV